MTLRVLDLFSGIGGFSLGLERAGAIETVAFCEIDPFCRAILAKHWPNVPIHEDVRSLDGREYKPDIVCGGYPCQPFSMAGQRRGEKDDRHLWPAMFDIIKRTRPTWVIGENVAGHISMGLDQVLSDLEGESYACQTFVIPACGVDAPHRRDRVFVVAHDDLSRHAQSTRCFEKCRMGTFFSGQAMADTQGEFIRAGLCQGEAVERRGRSSNRRSSPGNWLTEPPMGRVAHGVPNRVDRLRALGKAVVPQIPEMIGRAILSSMEAA